MRDVQNRIKEAAEANQSCQKCPEAATTMYATSCHGDWFFCQKHNDEYQREIKKIDAKFDLRRQKNA